MSSGSVRSRQLDKLNLSWADVVMYWGICDRSEMVDFIRFYGTSVVGVDLTRDISPINKTNRMGQINE